MCAQLEGEYGLSKMGMRAEYMANAGSVSLALPLQCNTISEQNNYFILGW